VYLEAFGDPIVHLLGQEGPARPGEREGDLLANARIALADIDGVVDRAQSIGLPLTLVCQDLDERL